MDNISLAQDLVRWVAQKPRAYQDVLDAWQTSCPRLTIWEDVVDAGLVDIRYDSAENRVVSVSKKGKTFLAAARRGLQVDQFAPAGKISNQKPG